MATARKKPKAAQPRPTAAQSAQPAKRSTKAATTRAKPRAKAPVAQGKSGLDSVSVGQHYSFAKTVGETDVTLFAGLTGDFSDTHINDQYMRERSNLGGRIAHGALLVGYMSTASTLSIAHVIHQEGLTDFPVTAGYDRMRFLRPVKLGETVTTHYTVIAVDRERGRSTAKVEAKNEAGELVAVAEHIMRWAKKLSSSGN